MPLSMIRDYLQTQGVRLPEDEVRIAQLAAEAVMNTAQASIDRNVLWYALDGVSLQDHLSDEGENEGRLKQVFMALDAAVEREQVQSAAVYLLMPQVPGYLVCLAQQGLPVERRLEMAEEDGWQYLASRSAQTGWLNVTDDMANWLSLGELRGEHNRRCAAAMSLPVCLPSGKVLGVVSIEADSPASLSRESQAQWVGLALALTEPLRALLGVPHDEAEE